MNLPGWVIDTFFPKFRIQFVLFGRSSGSPFFLMPSPHAKGTKVAADSKSIKRLTAAGTAPEF
jgi:hypothetical protein